MFFTRPIQRGTIGIIGDAGCGKTSLLLARRYQSTSYEIRLNKKYDFSLSKEDIPTADTCYEQKLLLGQKSIHMRYLDFSSDDSLKEASLRKMWYPHVSLFFICFAVNSIKQLTSAQSFWYPEVRLSNPRALVFLVGMKCDHRQEFSSDVVPMKTAQKMAMEMNATYVECSSQGPFASTVRQLFQTAAHSIVASKGRLTHREITDIRRRSSANNVTKKLGRGCTGGDLDCSIM